MLHSLTQGQVLNHVRARRRSPLSIGLPSSRSEQPRSQPDVERALHFQQVAQRIFSQLSPEHQEVIDKVILKGLTLADAAAVLEMPEGTLKSRLMAAKHALLAAAEPLLPASQRGPL
jgi:RNA polymerase sigma-70 factor (ECF subfamily)